MYQGNGPVPLQVGVWITSKSTNVVMHNSSSDKYAAITYKVLPVERLQLNSRYDTDQGWFLVVRQDFTVLFMDPKRGDRQITLK